MPREQLAWALVGWLNLLALAILGLVAARAIGYDITISWQLIVGVALLTAAVMLLLLGLMLRRR
ncbi:MAG: hypothetical protein R3C14_46175 [Caldilineaceae bacterium]